MSVDLALLSLVYILMPRCYVKVQSLQTTTVHENGEGRAEQAKALLGRRKVSLIQYLQYP